MLKGIRFPRWLVSVLAAVIGLHLVTLWIESRTTPADRAVRVIAAEAASEGFWAMTGVGEVIRARRGFQGFSVLSKDLDAFFAAQSPSVRFRARCAWTLSRLRLLTGGATHFENVAQFGRPDWSAGMTMTIRLSGLEFYRKSKSWDAFLGKIKI